LVEIDCKIKGEAEDRCFSGIVPVRDNETANETAKALFEADANIRRSSLAGDRDVASFCSFCTHKIERSF
jgi:hypothetical protein